MTTETTNDNNTMSCYSIRVTHNHSTGLVDLSFHSRNPERPGSDSVTTIPVERRLAHDLMRELRNVV